MIDRLPPPQNIEYEQRLIFVAVFGDDARFSIAADIVEPRHFYRTAHQIIWQAAVDLLKAGRPVDLMSVSVRLKESGKLEEAGGSAYLAKIIDELFMPSDVAHFAMTVRQYSVMRELIERANAIIRRAFDHNGEFQAVVDFAETSIRSIDCGTDEPARKVSELMLLAMDRYEKAKEGAGMAIKTGFMELDSLLPGGFSGSKLVIIAARPGIGKTAMMLSMARRMAYDRHRVAIMSLEMDADELMDRFVAMESNVNTVRLASSRITSDEWSAITDAGGRISGWPIRIDDAGGLTIAEIRRRCRKMATAGAEIIFIDQLSKITGGQGKSEYERRSDVVNQLALLKKELRMPIVLLAQINRQGEPDRPMLSNLKSTGSLEEDADIVLLGHRKYYYSRDPLEINQAQWDLAKHRGGPTRVIDLRWEPRLTLFTNPQQGGQDDVFFRT